MNSGTERFLRSCLSIIIVIAIFLGILLISGLVVFGTQLAG
jgi:hypothetical protein